jgi:hypothetical protein
MPSPPQFLLLENNPDMEKPSKSALLQVTPEPLTNNAGDGKGGTDHHELEGSINLGTKRRHFGVSVRSDNRANFMLTSANYNNHQNAISPGSTCSRVSMRRAGFPSPRAVCSTPPD